MISFVFNGEVPGGTIGDTGKTVPVCVIQGCRVNQHIVADGRYEDRRRRKGNSVRAGPDDIRGHVERLEHRIAGVVDDDIPGPDDHIPIELDGQGRVGQDAGGIIQWGQ